MASPERTSDREQRNRQAKYRRARVREFLFTVGPHRLTKGRSTQRHLAQDVVVRRLEFSSPSWPAGFDGLRIAHVSDFHLGPLLPVDRAVAVAGVIAAEAPDLVACTGDVVDLHHDEARPLLDAIAAVDAPFGSMLVLGNHDELHCPDALSAMATEAGLRVLRNDAVTIGHDGDHILIAGIEWAKRTGLCSRFVDVACGGEGAHLLLAHNPRAFLRAQMLGVPLTLAGHTHGGQVAMRRRRGANLAATRRHTAGHYRRGDSHLYVTAGVGAWFPLRVNCPAEVAMITMRRGPAGGHRLEGETEIAGG